jgi:phospholipase D-like protein
MSSSSGSLVGRKSHYCMRRRGGRSFAVNVHVNSLWGLIVLAADIWAIVNIFLSTTTTARKVLWTILVLILPVLGFLIWLFAGPRKGRT